MLDRLFCGERNSVEFCRCGDSITSYYIWYLSYVVTHLKRDMNIVVATPRIHNGLKEELDKIGVFMWWVDRLWFTFFVKHSVLLFIIITFVVGNVFFVDDTILINYIAREWNWIGIGWWGCFWYICVVCDCLLFIIC